MRPPLQHVPGNPTTPEPPQELLQVADRITHPLVRRTGISTTADGRWALYVTVPKTTEVPLLDLEEKAKPFPVVYEAEPDEPLRPFGK
jgi:hypothetical protein